MTHTTNDLIDLYKSGLSCPEISRLTGIPRPTINGRLRKLGVIRTISDGVKLSWKNRVSVNRADLTGERFTRLLVVSSAGSIHSNGRSYAAWNCVCDCGTERTVITSSLRSGNTKSCGCIRRGV